MQKVPIVSTRRCFWGFILLLVLATAYFSIIPLVIHFHCNRARALLHSRQDVTALEELRSALRLDPNNPNVHLLLARTHRRLGNLERASVFLRLAEECGGDAEQIRRALWLVSAQAGDLLSSEPHLGDLLADSRSDGQDICEAFVLGYFANLRINEAFAVLDAWQRDYPEDPRAYSMEGYLYQALAMNDEAVTAYRRGLELDPRRTAMRCRLAQVLLDTQETNDAMSLLRQCREEQPDNPEVLIALARGFVLQGAMPEASSVLQDVLRDHPGNFEALRLMGEVELGRGEFDRAAEILERAARERPYDTTTRNSLGKALRAAGRDAEAEPHFDYVSQAEESLANLERQLRLVVSQPEDVELRYQIGVTLLKYGAPEDAARWLRTVLQLDPDHAAARELLSARRGQAVGP